MKFSLKHCAATLAAVIGSTSAFAVDNASSNPGNSSLFITVFDPVKGASVTQDLGLNYLDFLNTATGSGQTDVTPDSGLVLNFNVDLSVFGQVGSNQSDLQYTVFAADGFGNYTSTAALVTAPLNAGAIPGLNSDVTGMYGSSGAGAVLLQWQTGCGNGVTCVGTAFSSTYFGGDNWGAQFGSYLDVNGSAGVGTALGFYQLTRSTLLATDPLNSTQYANANGVASWLLNSNGTLTWTVPGGSPVPVPAALWLLLSGLGSVGLVSRRKTVATIAA